MGGYYRFESDYGVVTEEDTFTCKHCNRVNFVPAKSDPNTTVGYCRLCDAAVCPHCVNPCVHFEKRLARDEARFHMLRDILG